VIARPESWSRPADRPRAALAAAVAILVFLGVWTLLHHGFYARTPIVDTPVYKGYGDAMAAGQVPYRDFRPEYPPAALPVFVLPSLGHHGDVGAFRRTFETLMAVCGAAALAFLAVALLALEADGRRVGGVLAFAALAPLALGSVVLSRYDLWPTALMVAGLAAVLARRERAGAGVLALGAAAKVFPAVVLPPALIYVWRRRGAREALACAAVAAAVVAVCFMPFLVVAPDGVWASLPRQAARPLQIESLGSAFLLAAHQVWGLVLTMRSSSGSQNLTGALPDGLATAQTVVQIGAVVALWIAFARGPAERERLVRYSAAALTAFVAFGKVLSPQFLIWLVPLVPLVRGRRGLAAAGLLAAALVLTQLWFPFRYWNLALRFSALPSWLVLARDLVLVALVAVLALPTRPRPAPLRS
jgi:hypothetical protein